MSTGATDALVAAIKRLAQHDSLSGDAIGAAFDVVMAGNASPVQVAALLMALRVKGERPEEVAGVARALRRAMIALPTDDASALVDTCGTGGGSVSTFNISTAAALLAAGAGVRIAKHGNRSFTSRSGSADVLEALGVKIDLTPAAMATVLREAGIVFMFAPLMHPAMKHVGPVRRELGVPTVMNIVGPLANPARAGRQVVGVAEAHRVELIAGALAELESVHALVVHGAPGMDEISPIGPTTVVELRAGEAPTRWTIDPAWAGEAGAEASHLDGGSPEENAALVEAVLHGTGAPGARAAVVLNAAAAIYISGAVPDFRTGVARARAALTEGAGAAALERLRRATNA
ncbi:MAG: anthranilate phosphoribosyltransferase [Gemmatimonadaceae bacterium]|jgi:anthranilate phosphoribosyltransferase|nr:anthranilate phosphoribosyltransferase [Gemmatimonadaceae bacterium]